MTSMAERATTLRLDPKIKEAVQDFADDLGITLNAAMSVLLVEALRARGIDPRAAKTQG